MEKNEEQNSGSCVEIIGSKSPGSLPESAICDSIPSTPEVASDSLGPRLLLRDTDAKDSGTELDNSADEFSPLDSFLSGKGQASPLIPTGCSYTESYPALQRSSAAHFPALPKLTMPIIGAGGDPPLAPKVPPQSSSSTSLDNSFDNLSLHGTEEKPKSESPKPDPALLNHSANDELGTAESSLTLSQSVDFET